MADIEDRYERFYMFTVMGDEVEICCTECDNTVVHLGGGSMRDIVASMDHHLDTCVERVQGEAGEGAE